MLGFLKRCTQDFTNVSAIRLLYCSLVRPHLDYASSVWNPSYACHIHRIEQVQRRFLRYLSFKANINANDYHYNYDVLYNTFALETLKCRRDQKDLKLLYKIINAKVDCPIILSSVGLSVPARNTRLVNTFYQPFYHTNFGTNSFIQKAARLATLFFFQILSINLCYKVCIFFIYLLKIAYHTPGC